MAATQSDIRRWLIEGQGEGATHAMIVCDTFDMADYPVYIEPGQSVEARLAEIDGKEMQRVMEVYNLTQPIEPQLAEERAWHVEPPETS